MSDHNDDHHIMWVYLLRFMEKVGPETSREILASTTDELKNAKIWPIALEAVTDELSEAYLCASGLKDGKPHVEASIRRLKQAFALDHVIELSKTSSPANRAERMAEIEELIADGYIPEALGVVPINDGRIDWDNAPPAIQQMRTMIQEGLDEYGATRGCGCPICTQRRVEAQRVEDQGYDPGVN